MYNINKHSTYTLTHTHTHTHTLKGVIDILQQYNLHKRAENFIKGFSNDRRQISAVDSITYASRFVAFFDANID